MAIAGNPDDVEAVLPLAELDDGLSADLEEETPRLFIVFPLVTTERLPFPEASFDGLTFTYLLRYVSDPVATLRELARVVRPGGTIAGLEFAVPHGVWRPFWELYVRVGLPLAGRLISPGWAEVGDFLGPSIRSFYARWPERRLLELWQGAGITGATSQRLSLGGGIVTWGRRA